jgi:hypothetical protein
MTEQRTSGLDPMDGLRLALLQQRADQLRKQLRFATFGLKEGLMVGMLAAGLTILLLAEPGRSYKLSLMMGGLLVSQSAVLYWSLRQTAARELQRIEQRIAVAADVPEAAVVAQAASAARELLLRKP